MSAMAHIQQAIYTRLDNDAPLAAAGYGVFDEPPDLNYDGSYVALGESTETEGPGSHTERAFEGTETLHVWFRGNSTLRAKQGVELVRAALESTPLQIADHRTMLVRYEFSTVIKGDGWRHMPVRFRIVTGSSLPVRAL